MKKFSPRKKIYFIIFPFLIIFVFAVTAYAWINFDIGLNKDHFLLPRFHEYSNMIDVGLCKETYDEFITKGSKERKGDNFYAHCDYRNEYWNNFEIQTVVISGDRADIKYTYDLSVVDIDSKQWRDCMELFKDIRSCNYPRKTKKGDSTETWLYEEGKWKRDY